MRAYRILAYAIAIEVVVQAAAIAFAVFGLGKYIDDGGVVTKANQEHLKFTGAVGFAIHGINGQMVIPLLALILLIVSLTAKFPGGRKWAGIVFGLVVLQVVLGMTAHAVPALGPLHGINAIALLATAGMAGRRVPVGLVQS